MMFLLRLRPLFLTFALFCAGAPLVGDVVPADAVTAVERASDGNFAQAYDLAAQDAVTSDLITWLRLRGGGAPFADYALFLAARPDWPDQNRLRARAEVMMRKGMDKDELQLAVQRHATSKLPDDDLLNIQFFGFRGEALPSIASVSRAKISSRHKDEPHGWSINVEGGTVEEVIPATLTRGTRIEIRDLFYTTPARLNFLKSDRSEAQQILEVMKKFALVEPHIAFSLTHNNKKNLFS